MSDRKKISVILFSVFVTAFCLGSLWAEIPDEPVEEHLAAVSVGTRGIQFRPKVISSGMVLSVSKPDPRARARGTRRMLARKCSA